MSSSTNDLALFLKLDEFVGDKVTDSSGKNRDGVLHGDPQLIPDDRFGSCLTFDGKDDFVTLPALNVDFSNGLTISACVYFSSFKTRSRIIDLGKGRHSDNIVLYNKETTNDLVLSILQGTNNVFMIAPGALTLNKWLHVVATVNKEGASLLVDGKKVASGALRLPASVNRDTNFIGKSNWDVDGLFHGKLANIRLYNRALTSEELMRDMQEDYTAKASFAAAYPLDFNLHDDDYEPVIYIDSAAGHNLSFEVNNVSRQSINLAAPTSDAVGPTNHHFELKFRPGTLSQATLDEIALRSDGWKMSKAQSDGMASLYFLSKTARTLEPGGSIKLRVDQVRADGSDGSRGTRVEFKYRQANYSGAVPELTGTRLQHLSIVNVSGQKHLPLHVGFVDSNKILNEGGIANKLTLRMTNVLHEHAITLNDKDSKTPSTFTLSFDSGENDDLALGTLDEMKDIWPIEDAGWHVDRPTQNQKLKWILTTSKTSIEPGKYLQLDITKIKSSKPSGNTNLYIRYENIPGYADGQIVCVIEKGPVINKGPKIGIGTTDPKAKLQVANGAIMPATGNTESTGIMFLKDPNADTANAAWIRYYPAQGKAMNLEIGIANDANDNLVLKASGRIGIGTASPPSDAKVTISNPTAHLKLLREKTETKGGNVLFLELQQDDTDPPKIPEVYPSIRFHHGYRFWNRIEGRPSGIHFKFGELAKDDYIDTFAKDGFFSGKVSANDGQFSGNMSAKDGLFSGKVGAGTNAPSTNLSVVGSMNIGANASATGLVTKVFEGKLESVSQVILPLYSLKEWQSSHLEVIAMIQKYHINQHTNEVIKFYFKADYGWTRNSSAAPRKHDLWVSYSKLLDQGMMDRVYYSVDTIAEGNAIQLKISQTGDSSAANYQIVARYMITGH